MAVRFKTAFGFIDIRDHLLTRPGVGNVSARACVPINHGIENHYLGAGDLGLGCALLAAPPDSLERTSPPATPESQP